MAEAGIAADIQPQGAPAPLVRIIGWAVLGALAAFLINNILNIGFGVPVPSEAFSGGGAAAFVPIAVYVAVIGLGTAYVLRSGNTPLRADALRIHNFNLYIIRACFWVVLLVGIVDSAIAVMRVEKVLDQFLSEDTVRNLGLARYVGMYIHMPLIVAGMVIALFTRTLGFTWLALMIVFAELLIVFSRFIFSYEQALMGDLVRYWYAALFLFASAYTLFEDGHVRVDVLYAGFSNRTRGYVNAIGSIFLGVSTCWVILVIGLSGRQSIINAPVVNFEITQTGGVGMFVKYQMAAFLAIFAITMMIQFIAYFFEAVADYRDEPGHRDVTPTGH
ncbi:MAG: TRAP transporter small permease subunit [Rhodobacteraceae bacterium]|nr:TRAP transporter small permease subunit [Paracoccaceae bacterium]